MGLPGLILGVSRAVFLQEALGENTFPCLLQLLEATCIPWLVTSSSIFRSLSPSSSPLLLTLLCPTLGPAG